jgi:SAM-dependent methyltransferase
MAPRSPPRPGREHCPASSLTYSLARPRPPPSLAASILRHLGPTGPPAPAAAGPGLAVDVGCGSGQLTVQLAAGCRAVLGLDTSAAQLQVFRGDHLVV